MLFCWPGMLPCWQRINLKAVTLLRQKSERASNLSSFLKQPSFSLLTRPVFSRSFSRTAVFFRGGRLGLDRLDVNQFLNDPSEFVHYSAYLLVNIESRSHKRQFEPNIEKFTFFSHRFPFTRSTNDLRPSRYTTRSFKSWFIEFSSHSKNIRI